MHIATISSQRQITLPKAYLTELTLSIKDKVKISINDQKLILEPVLSSTADLAGSLLAYIPKSKIGTSYVVAKKVAIKNIIQDLASE